MNSSHISNTALSILHSLSDPYASLIKCKIFSHLEIKNILKNAMSLRNKIKFTDQIRNSIANSEYKALIFPK